jgi:drug/metabolite transporter (DMT)-like permease
LLLGTGTALGLNFPLGKFATAAGVTPALWAATISLGAGLAMLAAARYLDRGRAKAKGIATFAIVSGLVSYVAPNFLTFSAIPHIGSGLAAIRFALSPLATASLSLMLRVRPPSAVGVLGIGVGFAGALVIIFSRNLDYSAAASSWLFLSLLIPAFFAAGNIYRTLAWPEGASPIGLAWATNLAAVPPLLAATVLTTGSFDLAPLAAVPGLVIAQLVVSTTMFLMFFRLQQMGGPTYLSQIGYVAAAVGAGVGVTLLGETYPPAVWFGAGIVATGIVLTTLAHARQARA